MRQDEIVKWYSDILQAALEIGKDVPGTSDHALATWTLEATLALGAVFPSTHQLSITWSKARNNRTYNRPYEFQRLLQYFRLAQSIIEKGRMGGLIEAIRAESESELLDQAESLLNHDYLVAATVIAGGTLETHLRHYCQKEGLTITGDGGISKYNGAVGQARKANPSQKFYSANDGKQVEAWGGIRNEAAHTPGSFNRTKEEVTRMVEGIRGFIDRTT